MDSSGQISAALRSVGSKIVKETTKKVTKKSIKNESAFLRNLKKITKASIKNKGIKSYLNYSVKGTKNIFGKRMIITKTNDILKEYNSPICRSIKGSKLVYDNLIESVPKGMKALQYKWAGKQKGYIPVYENSSSKIVNQLLLAERRKAISPYNQFPTKAQLMSLDKSILENGKPANAAVLRRNLFKSMERENENLVNAFGGAAAHHVVPGDDPRAKACRKILEKFKIDINSPENGILLPEKSNSIFKGTLHKTGHSDHYIKSVYVRLKDCKSKEEAVEALYQIKYDLYNGKLMLEGSKGSINKNIKVVIENKGL